MRIGIYGGTFNPPHLGHLTAARTAFELLKLDKLYLIPAAVPPHKPLPPGSPDAAERLEVWESGWRPWTLSFGGKGRATPQTPSGSSTPSTRRTSSGSSWGRTCS